MLRAATDLLAAALFPVRCAACSGVGEPLCEGCVATLCRPSAAPPPDGVCALGVAFAYHGAARELVARLKYRNARHSLGWLADAVAAEARRRIELPATITWIPTTAARRRARGFDHAELLARNVARRLDVPAIELLVRVDEVAQTGRNAAERRIGPHFKTRRTPIPSRVVVVDDVVTTGATLRAAARLLREHGAEVSALAIARTPPRG